MSKKTYNEPIISEIPESYQRYVDEIYAISHRRGGWVSNKELAEKLDVKPASVTGMLEKLEKQGLIEPRKPRNKIRLTYKGKSIAKQLDEAHELLSSFFKKVLKIRDENVVDNLSCEIEHHITPDVKEALKDFLSKYL